MEKDNEHDEGADMTVPELIKVLSEQDVIDKTLLPYQFIRRPCQWCLDLQRQNQRPHRYQTQLLQSTRASELSSTSTREPTAIANISTPSGE